MTKGGTDACGHCCTRLTCCLHTKVAVVAVGHSLVSDTHADEQPVEARQAAALA